MAARDITQFFIYRWRYIVGYSIVGLLLAGLLIFAGLYVPGGLSTAEMQAAVHTDSLSFAHPSSFGITSLPFYLLQATMFHFFGVYDFTIKAPALILALFSAIGLILLLRRWFRPSIAVLTSLIAITTGQFLFIAQSGTPGILYVFWPILLLSLGTQITRVKKGRLLWKISFAAAAALSLYTPLSIYPLLAIAVAIALHPHLRTVVRRLSRMKVAISAAVGLILIAPLLYLIATQPQFGLTLLGAPANWPPDIGQNTIALLKQFFLFWEPSTTTLMTPVFGLGSVLIIGLGLYRLIQTRDTTRSYLIIIWIICLIPVLIINPQFTSVTLVPSVLLLAAGLTSLITYWYRLFPLNPYARVAGLIPIIILVVTLIGSGLDRYMYGYHYSPTNAVNFSNDLTLLPANTKRLIVAPDELPFYTVVAHHRKGLVVTATPPDLSIATFVATRAARDEAPGGYAVARIITTTYTDDSDRFYVYKMN
jgi:4-amino-4-deoxy-L-arabinose transferase-like glycosyltransferase